MLGRARPPPTLRDYRPESGHEVRRRRKINVTDPDSRNLKTTREWAQGYNAQAVVGEGQIVLAAEISTESLDTANLQPMIQTAVRELPDWLVPVASSVVDQCVDCAETFGIMTDAGAESAEHGDDGRGRPVKALECGVVAVGAMELVTEPRGSGRGESACRGVATR